MLILFSVLQQVSDLFILLPEPHRSPREAALAEEYRQAKSALLRCAQQAESNQQLKRQASFKNQNVSAAVAASSASLPPIVEKNQRLNNVVVSGGGGGGGGGNSRSSSSSQVVVNATRWK